MLNKSSIMHDSRKNAVNLLPIWLYGVDGKWFDLTLAACV